jgi:hypothetical protein
MDHVTSRLRLCGEGSDVSVNGEGLHGLFINSTTPKGGGESGGWVGAFNVFPTKKIKGLGQGRGKGKQ